MLKVLPYYLPDYLDMDIVQSSGNLIFRVVLTIQRVSKEGKETFDQTSWENLVHCAPFKESQMHTNMLKFLRNPVVKKPI